LSALGAARADLEGDLVEPVYERLGALAATALPRLTADLQARAAAWISEQTASLAVTGTRIELAADMRYDGQGYDVTVPLDAAWLAAGDVARLRAAFHNAHRATYGHANENAEIWLKELRAHIIGAMPQPRIAPLRAAAAAGWERSRSVRLFGREFAASVHQRAALDAGRRLAGPAIVNQMDTTTWIPPGWQAAVVPSGALVLERTG
jgi:N-methylhydantoinase A